MLKSQVNQFAKKPVADLRIGEYDAPASGKSVFFEAVPVLRHGEPGWYPQQDAFSHQSQVAAFQSVGSMNGNYSFPSLSQHSMGGSPRLPHLDRQLPLMRGDLTATGRMNHLLDEVSSAAATATWGNLGTTPRVNLHHAQSLPAIGSFFRDRRYNDPNFEASMMAGPGSLNAAADQSSWYAVPEIGSPLRCESAFVFPPSTVRSGTAISGLPSAFGMSAQSEFGRSNPLDDQSCVELIGIEDDSLEETAEELEQLALLLREGDQSIDPYQYFHGSPGDMDMVEVIDFQPPKSSHLLAASTESSSASPATAGVCGASLGSSPEWSSAVGLSPALRTSVEQFRVVKQRLCELRPDLKTAMDRISPFEPGELMSFFERICVQSPVDDRHLVHACSMEPSCMPQSMSADMPMISMRVNAKQEISMTSRSGDFTAMELAANRSIAIDDSRGIVGPDTHDDEQQGAVTGSLTCQDGERHRHTGVGQYPVSEDGVHPRGHNPLASNSVFAGSGGVPVAGSLSQFQSRSMGQTLAPPDGRRHSSSLAVPQCSVSPVPIRTINDLPRSSSVGDSAPKSGRKVYAKSKKLYYQNKEFYVIRDHLRDLAKLQNEISRKEKLLKCGSLFYNQLTSNGEPGDWVYRSVRPLTPKKKVDNESLTNRKVTVVGDVTDAEISQYSDCSTRPFQYFGPDAQTQISEKLMRRLEESPATPPPPKPETTPLPESH